MVKFITNSDTPIIGLNGMVELITKNENITYHYFYPEYNVSNIIDKNNIVKITYNNIIMFDSAESLTNLPYNDVFWQDIYSNHMLMRKNVNLVKPITNIENQLTFLNNLFVILTDDEITLRRIAFTTIKIPTNALFYQRANDVVLKPYISIDNSIMRKLIPNVFSNKVILAGGAIMSHILGVTANDYDMFFTSKNDFMDYYNYLYDNKNYLIVKNSISQFAISLKLVEKHKRNDEYTNILQCINNLQSLHNYNCDNIITELKQINKRIKQDIIAHTYKIQLILKVYKNVSDIIIGFDLPASAAMFYNNKIYAAPRFMHSLSTRIHYLDPSVVSNNYVHRLAKYAYKGIAIVVPHFNPVEWLNNNPTHETAIIINNKIILNQRVNYTNNLGYLTYLHFHTPEKRNIAPSDYTGYTNYTTNVEKSDKFYIGTNNYSSRRFNYRDYFDSSNCPQNCNWFMLNSMNIKRYQLLLI